MEEVTFSTKRKYESVDITDKVKKCVPKNLKEGMCLVYTPHATAAIIVNENWDPNVCDDILEALGKMVPEGVWKHDKVGANGAAHIKSAILGPSETVLIKDGKLLLGRWQNIMLCDFDGPRDRAVFVKIESD